MHPYTLPTHGLHYPDALLDSLQILSQQSTSPIRALPPSTFTSLHLNHILAHPPDNVLFPFLHGLEGDNEAQNLFFANNASPSPPRHLATTPSKNKVPKYRGLVWVVCEDDLDGGADALLGRRSSHVFDDDDDELDDEDDEDDDDDDDEEESSYSDESDDNKPFVIEHPMDVDVDLVGDPRIRIIQDDSTIELVDPNPVPIHSQDPDSAKHMHPVHHRPQQQHKPTTPSIQTINLPPAPKNLTPTPTTATTTTTPSPSSTTSFFPPASPSSTTPTTPSPPPKTKNKNKTAPPLLTSTFRPKDLLRETADGVWEFVPLKVPDGISLRNFGIQVVSRFYPLLRLGFVPSSFRQFGCTRPAFSLCLLIPLPLSQTTLV